MSGWSDDTYRVRVDGESVSLYRGDKSRCRAAAMAEGALLAGAKEVQIFNDTEIEREKHE